MVRFGYISTYVCRERERYFIELKIKLKNVGMKVLVDLNLIGQENLQLI